LAGTIPLTFLQLSFSPALTSPETAGNDDDDEEDFQTEIAWELMCAGATIQILTIVALTFFVQNISLPVRLLAQ
jgi:ABC-type glycerol-3-phosphate transport system permease component